MLISGAHTMKAWLVLFGLMSVRGRTSFYLCPDSTVLILSYVNDLSWSPRQKAWNQKPSPVSMIMIIITYFHTVWRLEVCAVLENPFWIIVDVRFLAMSSHAQESRWTGFPVSSSCGVRDRTQGFCLPGDHSTHWALPRPSPHAVIELFVVSVPLPKFLSNDCQLPPPDPLVYCESHF